MKDRDWVEFMNTLGHDPHLAAPSWDSLRSTALACTRCDLARTRTQVVFGAGSTSAPYMFVGEAPGQREDETGEPFSGEAGELLSKMILAMGLSRNQVYLANLIKCRPPQNRDPELQEIEACHGYLDAQITAIRPRWIIALGTSAAQYLLQSEESIARLRGRMHDSQRWFSDTPVKIVPTYHPVFLLRNPEMKKAAWDDLQLVMRDALLTAN